MTTDETRVPGVNLDSITRLKSRVTEKTATIEDYRMIDYLMEEFDHVLRPELFSQLREAGVYSWETFIEERNKLFARRIKVVELIAAGFHGFLRGVQLALMTGDLEPDFSEP